MEALVGLQCNRSYGEPLMALSCSGYTLHEHNALFLIGFMMGMISNL